MDDPTLTLWVIAVVPLFYLIAISFVLLRNAIDFTDLTEEHTDGSDDISYPKISVCIPARNEKDHIDDCLNSLLTQDYTPLEILVLDDQSEDSTAARVQEFEKHHSSVRLLHGKNRPQGWLGKPWACQQLADHATGDILIFIDADCRLEDNCIKRIALSMGNENLDALTVWPRQILGSFWEKVLIPTVYYALLSFLPAVYVHRKPRWMPESIYTKISHWFAAACGQCFAFRRRCYDGIGGHASVKNEIVEDVALAKLLKREGYKLKMFHGVGTLSCRMYTSEQEIFEGFRKNFFAGFGYRTVFFTVAGATHLWVYVLPVILLPIVLVTTSPLLIAVLPTLVLMGLHRLLLNLIFHWPLHYFWAQPLAVIWFTRLSITTLKDYYQSRSVQWKNREIA